MSRHRAVLPGQVRQRQRPMRLARASGKGIRTIAHEHGVGGGTVQRLTANDPNAVLKISAISANLELSRFLGETGRFWYSARPRLVHNAGGDQPRAQLPRNLAPFRTLRLVVRQRVQDLLHEHPRREELARVQRAEPVLDGRPGDAGRFQLGNFRGRRARPPIAPCEPCFPLFPILATRSVRSRLRLTVPACQLLAAPPARAGHGHPG